MKIKWSVFGGSVIATYEYGTVDLDYVNEKLAVAKDALANS